MSKNPWVEFQKLGERIRTLERIKNPTSYQVSTLKRLRKEFAIIVARL
jgi:hypothetical protein